MKTKTLILTALMGLAGGAVMADVYSLNVVGYVNKTIPSGYSLIANPLTGAVNTVGTMFADAVDGTTIYKFNSATATYSINAKDFGEFSDPNQTLLPGEGAFIANAGAPLTVTFVGEAATGVTSNAIPQGFSIKSSKVPQSGQLDTVLGFPVVDGDVVYLYNNATSQYTIHSFDFGEWSIAPVPAVGESFFVAKGTATVWNRTFSVNN